LAQDAESRSRVKIDPSVDIEDAAKRPRSITMVGRALYFAQCRRATRASGRPHVTDEADHRADEEDSAIEPGQRAFDIGQA